MYPFLNQYSFKATPGMPLSEMNENKLELLDNGIRRTFLDVSNEIKLMPESKKNMLNCD